MTPLKIVLAFTPCWLGYLFGTLGSKLLVLSSRLQDWATADKGFPWEPWDAAPKED